MNEARERQDFSLSVQIVRANPGSNSGPSLFKKKARRLARNCSGGAGGREVGLALLPILLAQLRRARGAGAKTITIVGLSRRPRRSRRIPPLGRFCLLAAMVNGTWPRGKTKRKSEGVGRAAGVGVRRSVRAGPLFKYMQLFNYIERRPRPPPPPRRAAGAPARFIFRRCAAAIYDFHGNEKTREECDRFAWGRRLRRTAKI